MGAPQSKGLSPAPTPHSPIAHSARTTILSPMHTITEPARLTRLIETHGCLGGTWPAGRLAWIANRGEKHVIVEHKR